MIDTCLFCGGDRSEPNHERTCDGQQGKVEATPFAPYRHFENVRTSDPSTSKAAAASVAVTEVQARVLTIHRRHSATGLTDEELLAHYQREFVTPESSPRKRRCDLAKVGIIVDSGERRLLSTGRSGIVWRVNLAKVAAA